jgi:hypothetical protein
VSLIIYARSHVYLIVGAEQFSNAQFQRATLTGFKDTFAKLKADLLGDMTLQILIDVYDIHKLQQESDVNRKHSRRIRL